MTRALADYRKQPQDEGDLISVSQAAELLDASEAVVLRQASKRIVPFHRRNNRMLFRESELQHMLRTDPRWRDLSRRR